MKYIATGYCLLLALLVSGSLQAQQLPSQKNILEPLERANAYFMNKWPDAGKTIITNKERPSNIWTRAVYYEGLMALYNIDPQKAYYDYAEQWGNFHHWNLREGIGTRNADNQACGQTYIAMYLLDKKKEERIQNIKASIDSMLRTDKIDDWTWIDAIQMAMPVFAELGSIYQNNAYWERMYQMYAYTKNKQGGGLYNTTEHLWWRDKDFVPPYKEPNGEDCYWSRGNGWVFAALVRTMNALPENQAHYAEYKTDFLNMAEALAPLQRADGFWNCSLHDSTHFGGKEVSGTALFTYGMAWGIRKGYLSKKKYLPIVLKAWNGLVHDALHADGKLGYVQGTGKEPKDGQPVTYDSTPDFEDYGLGCFLLAGSELSRLTTVNKLQ